MQRFHSTWIQNLRGNLSDCCIGLCAFGCLLTVNVDVQAQGAWQSNRSSGFSPCQRSACYVTDTLIYLFYGDTYGPTGVGCKVFNPRTQIWGYKDIGDSVLLAGGLGGIEFSGVLYYLGGTNTRDSHDTLRAYDIIRDSAYWPSTSGSHLERTDFCTAEVDDQLYVIGGFHTRPSSTALDSAVEVFDPSSRSWSTLHTIGRFTPRQHSATCVVDRKIWVIGGDTLSGDVNTVEVFNPADNSWTTPATSGTFYASSEFAAEYLGGKIYAIGGGYEQRHSLQVLDLSTGSWTEGPSDPTPRTRLSSCVWHGKIYTFGGYRPHDELNTVEVFDPNGMGAVSTSIQPAEPAILPNPATSTIRLTQLPTLRQPITVTNLLGQQVMSIDAHDRTSIPLDVSSLPPGPYFVQLVTNTGIETRKFVKQ
jgi:hypothetical protein